MKTSHKDVVSTSKHHLHPFLKWIPKNSRLSFVFCFFLFHHPPGCWGFFSSPHRWIPHRRGGLSRTPEFLQACLQRSFKVLLHVATFPAHQWEFRHPWHSGLLLSLRASFSRFTTCGYFGPAVKSNSVWEISCTAGCCGQKFMSRDFSKLYQYHGRWCFFFFVHIWGLS